MKTLSHSIRAGMFCALLFLCTAQPLRAAESGAEGQPENASAVGAPAEAPSGAAPRLPVEAASGDSSTAKPVVDAASTQESSGQPARARTADPAPAQPAQSPPAPMQPAQAQPLQTEVPIAPVVLPTPQKVMEVSGRYSFGAIYDQKGPVDDAVVSAVVLAASETWKVPRCQVAWYAAGKKPGQGIAVLGEVKDGNTLRIRRPRDDEEAVRLEKMLCFPTTPTELSRFYLENEVVADEDFKGKPVLFTAVVADIARGAFGRPYVFFPNADGSVTGLTCYFDNKDPALRKIRKGVQVTVRAVVKGFLMQDVILDPCSLLSVGQ